MSKPASIARLGELHVKVTEAFIRRLDADAQDAIFTDAATLGAVTKFLKDNSVSADPADQDDLKELREQFRAQSEARRNRRGAALSAAIQDIKEA